MPLLGKIVKTTIGIVSEFTNDEKDPVEEQKKILQMLLEKAKDTEFGKHYDFQSILESEDLAEAFRNKVPCYDYERIKDQWWHKTIDGTPDVTWPGNPDYFALSSGTTGSESKRIPVTDDMITAIRNTGVKQVLSLSKYGLPDEFFEKEIMMLGSSTDLTEREGHLEGEISGISASNIPFWFKGYYKPGEDIAAIDDWDDRIQHIAEKAKDWDIGALSGIPTWIEMMLKKVVEYNNLNHIHEIWPSLAVYTSGGVPFEPHRESLEKLLGQPLLYLDTYLASEGFIALQLRDNEDMAMQLAFDEGIYFEFIPFDEQYFDDSGSPLKDAPSVSIGEVEEGKEYAMIISTVSGAWRYSIGDTIQFTDKSKAEIKITGRTKFFLNVVGSQLSVNKMDDALRALEEEYNINLPEFTVAAIKIDGEFHHQWILGTDDPDQVDGEKLAKKLDELLIDANKNYGVARKKALKGVHVKLIDKEVFYDWSEENKKKGGQIKVARVVDEEEMLEFLEFTRSKPA